jgi:hypothetical protein
MTSINTRRALAAIVVAACLAIPAAASAMPDSAPTTTRSDAAQSGGATGNGTPHKPVVGDDIWSHPGMPGFPEYDPPTTTTVEVVRPERTIVRDVDQALPLILSGTALALVLAGLGIALVRMRLVPRPGRSH